VNILFLTHRLPYSPNRGDRVRAFHLLHEMAGWARVDLVSLVHDEQEIAQAKTLAAVTRSVTVGRVPRTANTILSCLNLGSAVPTTHTMLRSPGLDRRIENVVAANRPDVILCFCTGVGPLTETPLLRQVPLVMDMVDVDSQKWAGMAAAGAPPLSWIYRREARVLARYEAAVAARATCTTVVTPKELESLRQLAPQARIEVVANGVDTAKLRRPDGMGQRAGVVFCGVMNYGPNVEAVKWFATRVWPLVRAQAAGATFTIVGSEPTDDVKALAREPGVTITGAVDDIRPHLWNSAVSVAPLLTARGVQNKVMEAVAAGLPVVITPVVEEGLPGEIKAACTTAATEVAFSEAVVRLLGATQQARDEIVARSSLDGLSWQRRLAPMRGLLEEAAGRIS
jgi:sugar transferase (PEP-CTERM/EpsH1 system associated)